MFQLKRKYQLITHFMNEYIYKSIFDTLQKGELREIILLSVFGANVFNVPFISFILTSSVLHMCVRA